MADILWEGPSLFDNESPIRVYLTGHNTPSDNDKTGDMMQLWIMRADMEPTEAVRSGADSAICGNCVHRTAPRSCYVNVGHAPLSIHRSRNNRELTGTTPILRNKIRLGAYGDPAAVPYEFWRTLLSQNVGWTGYTHQWLRCDQRMKRFCMASCESLAERDQAHGLGWRVFLVGEDMDDMPDDGRITLCPASAQAGKKLQCNTCMACSGLGVDNRVGDVFIPVHGNDWMRRNFLRKVA